MPCEYHCEDCSSQVFHAGLDTPPTPPLCSTCALMRTMTPEDRQQFKEILDTIQLRKVARKAGLHV